MALTVAFLGASRSSAVDGVPGVTADADTIFLLQVNAAHNGVTDTTGHFNPTVAGTVTYSNDAALGGWAIKMGDKQAT